MLKRKITGTKLEIIDVETRGVAIIMEKYRHKLFWRGICSRSTGSMKAHGLCNRKGDGFFNHFGSAFNTNKILIISSLF
jgi:hypothetical protein